jgi:hypothetical protein
LSLGIGLLSLVIASTALCISLMNSRPSEKWENKQLELLSAIRSDLNAKGEAILDHLTEPEHPLTLDHSKKVESGKR